MLESVSHLLDVVSKSSVGPTRSATRILDGNHEGRCRGHALRHVLGRGAQGRVVVPRHEASGSERSAVDVENERDWTLEPSDRDTLQVLLLRETLGTDHAFLGQKRTEGVKSLRKSANVSRKWAMADGVSSQKSCLEPKRQESTSDPTRSCANVPPNAWHQQQHKSPGPGISAHSCSGQDVKKNVRAKTV